VIIQGYLVVSFVRSCDLIIFCQWTQKGLERLFRLYFRQSRKKTKWRWSWVKFNHLRFWLFFFKYKTIRGVYRYCIWIGLNSVEKRTFETKVANRRTHLKINGAISVALFLIFDNHYFEISMKIQKWREKRKLTSCTQWANCNNTIEVHTTFFLVLVSLCC